MLRVPVVSIATIRGPPFVGNVHRGRYVLIIRPRIISPTMLGAYPPRFRRPYWNGFFPRTKEY
jgi:hypothetical protein